MKNIVIKNIDDRLYFLLDSESKKKGISKNKLLKEILESYFLNSNSKNIEEKYQALVQENLKVINENNKILKMLLGD
ncbi:hypothetical protein [Parvimonas micra]|uniref:hypothetical protein n=1 Tax=Parvimonas micra TaxID=33033 RepID=UPI00123ACDDF|nr:hypothetical protein [Parvimonas micra]